MCGREMHVLGVSMGGVVAKTGVATDGEQGHPALCCEL